MPIAHFIKHPNTTPGHGCCPSTPPSCYSPHPSTSLLSFSSTPPAGAISLNCGVRASSVSDEFPSLGGSDNSLTAPVNVTIKALKANSAVVTWDIPEGDPVIGFAITQQKKDVRMLRFIQEVNTTTRSCALWDLEEETDYIVHVQYISMSGSSPPSEALHFRTPKEAEQLASKSKD
ncbi:hypothetical protein SKAU_G00420130 [Synaphobranchus kaupii]|uniref:Fibronectin type-III domain-containing protein n=1 Tax=Synaphobranchus kaupii TaxID=118154 RepID=A0A9Q1E6H8_SYNKA|nr:hypothetical protein SKAU_G00420130 [Synaphobranchus kaupii]